MSARIIETDGIGAHLCLRVCSWCKKELGAVVCLPENAGKITHTMCDACHGGILSALPSDRGTPTGLMGGRTSPATAQPTLNEAAAARSITMPGALTGRDKGTAAPSDNIQSGAALELHPSGGPAASFIICGADRNWLRRLWRKLTRPRIQIVVIDEVKEWTGGKN